MVKKQIQPGSVIFIRDQYELFGSYVVFKTDSRFYKCWVIGEPGYFYFYEIDKRETKLW